MGFLVGVGNQILVVEGVVVQAVMVLIVRVVPTAVLAKHQPLRVLIRFTQQRRSVVVAVVVVV